MWTRRRPRVQYLNHVRCPECGVPMAERTGKDGAFYGCARFPACVGTRPIGPGQDSFGKLLQEAYGKAVVFLSSPKFFGPVAAESWLLEQGLGRAVSPNEPTNTQLLTNETLERAVDAACAYVMEKGVDFDFLVAAHEARMTRIRSRLKFEIDADTFRRMPKAEIVRRYDSGVLEQFEAAFSAQWKKGGKNCPRCGGYSEPVPVVTKLSLFDVEDLTRWDCGNCGPFERVEADDGKAGKYIFANDKKDSMSVPGIDFGTFVKKEDT